MRMQHLLNMIALCALCVLVFIAGAASQYFNWPLLAPLTQALEGGKAWLESQADADEIAQQSAPGGNVMEALSQAKATVNDAQAMPGYTLITMRYSNSVYLLDMEGNIVHSWNMPFNKAWSEAPHIRGGAARAAANIRSAQLFPNGDVLVVYEALRDSPYGYGIAKLDKDSHVVWTYSGNAHHDMYVDRENGHIFTLTQAYLPKPIEGLEALPFPLMADYVTILSGDGKELKKISILEAFNHTPFAALLFQGKKEEFPRWDHMHANAIAMLEPHMADQFPLFKPGSMLVSLRNLNIVAVIDPVSEKVVWAYNGLWQGQHSPAFMPNGHIVLFDNYGQVDGSAKKDNERKFSRIIEFDPASYQVAWSYTGAADKPFYSYVYGRVQPLENGHFFVTETLSGRLFELTREGGIVWEYTLPPVFKKKRTPGDPKKGDLLTSITSAIKYDEGSITFLTTRKGLKHAQ